MGAMQHAAPLRRGIAKKPGLTERNWDKELIGFTDRDSRPPAEITASVEAGKALLEQCGIAFTLRIVGGKLFLLVDDGINLDGGGAAAKLRQLPDFSRVLVKGDFICTDNKLQNLRGAPPFVGGLFDCRNNGENGELGNFNGAPRHFGTMQSDLGSFKNAAHLRDVFPGILLAGEAPKKGKCEIDFATRMQEFVQGRSL